MEYFILFISWASIIISIIAAIAAYVKKKNGGLGILAAGMFLSGVSLFYLLFSRKYSCLQSVLYSVIRTLQMFLLNNTLDDLISSYGGASMLYEC